MIRVADYIIQFLVEQGVRDIFMVTGGGSIFLSDAIYLNKDMNYYCCHHEQAVAMAAESYARARRGLGASLVTTGPGGTNAITGVAGSWMDSVPHITISGQAFLAQTIGDSGLRQLGVQEINIIDMVKPITKYAVMVKEPETIRYHLEKAVYLATHGRPGPVWLDLPANIQNSKVDISKLKGFDPKECQILFDQDLPSKVAEVVKLLKNSNRPLIHLGHGVRLDGVDKEFIALLEQHNIPFVTARNANDIVDSDHPLFVGRPGTFAQRGANFAVQTSDVYIAVGTRLCLSQTGYNAKEYAKNATKVMIDVDQAELNKKSLDIDLKIHSRAKFFLTELEIQLGDFRGPDSWVKRCQEWKANYPVVLPEYSNQQGSINSYHFTDRLADELNSQDVIVTDMGSAFQGTHQALKVKQGQIFFTNGGLASMGWGLPAAIGACVGSGRRRTTCITGDGGLMMNVQELSTLVAYNLPIKLFILNNGGYLTIKQTQELGFESRYIGINKETGLHFPDFIQLAQAHGLFAVRFGSHNDLEAGLSNFLTLPGPGVCEIMMDENQIQAPKAINRRKADGSMEPTPLEDLWPFLDRKEIEQNMSILNSKE